MMQNLKLDLEQDSKMELKPLLKYPGGKASEYRYFEPFIPRNIKLYVEPFVGGGAVYWKTEASKFLINDVSEELIALYKFVQSQDAKFIDYVFQISDLWNKKEQDSEQFHIKLEKEFSHFVSEAETFYYTMAFPTYFEPFLDTFDEEIQKAYDRKHRQLTKISQNTKIRNLSDNSISVVANAIYMTNRFIYNSLSFDKNPELKVALYLFLREFSYSSMFRFNKAGGFNVPYGGNSYNSKDLFVRLNQITDKTYIEKLIKTEIHNVDFSEILSQNYGKEDFIFLDPPYDSEFSEYNQESFGENEHRKLADLLKKQTSTKWLMVIKNTDLISELYKSQKNVFVSNFDKKYSVSFMNRNDSNAEHLIITNYKQEIIL